MTGSIEFHTKINRHPHTHGPGEQELCYKECPGTPPITTETTVRVRGIEFPLMSPEGQQFYEMLYE